MTPIKWNELTEKYKIGLIIEHIMRWTHFENWESFAQRQKRDEYPISFWNDQYGKGHWYVFYEKDLLKNAEIFDPLRSMSDAWLVVERITEPPQTKEEALKQAHTRFMLWWQGSDIWARKRADAAEAICVAALRCAGLEVVQ